MLEVKDVMEKHSINSVAWVIGVGIAVAMLVYWFRSCHSDEKRSAHYDLGFIERIGELEGRVNCMSPTVAKLDHLAFVANGSINYVKAELEAGQAFNSYEINRLNTKVYPTTACGYGNYGGGCGKGNETYMHKSAYIPKPDSDTIELVSTCNA